eukprot:UN28332
MNRTWIKSRVGICILDCCREYVEYKPPEEAKGEEEENNPKPDGKIVIHTAKEGDQAKAIKNSASPFSLSILKHLDNFDSKDIGSDLVKFFRLCASENSQCEYSCHGTVPPIIFNEQKDEQIIKSDEGGDTPTTTIVKETLQSVLESIDPSFVDYKVILMQKGVKSKERVYALTDEQLYTLGISGIPLDQWRKKVKY